MYIKGFRVKFASYGKFGSKWFHGSVCKSFCLFFTGRITLKKVVFPAPLVLNGVRLPWREKAVHLGHTLHQDLTLNADAKEKRARFIAKSVEVRSQFAFAAPPQILKAVQVLACNSYGSMLWRLDSAAACLLPIWWRGTWVRVRCP